MQAEALTPLIEALLFASGQPMSVNTLVKAVGDRDVSAAEIKQALTALGENYDREERGFKLVRLGPGYQVVTRARYEPWVKKMLAGKQKARLSRASLETVAVVAYKQPITRLEIERIRGVDVGGVLSTLLERNLIMIKGRDPGPGRPLLYGTTHAFLNYFGIEKLGDLPKMEEIAALTASEAPAGWDETERARFERHGVDPEAPEEGETTEGTDPQDEGEEISEEPRGDEEHDEAELLQDEERELFQEVATDFASSASRSDEEPAVGEPAADQSTRNP